MAFVQKYEKGKTLINELKDSAKEYVVENVNEATNPLKSTSENVPDKVNTSDTPIIKPTVNTKAEDKITINGVDINKKLLIDNLKKKSFSATGLNRVAWDKILGKLENLSEYNSSNTLDIDYGSDLKYDVKDLENRGNLILSEILKEASSNTYAYKEKEKTPFTFSKFLGTELGLGKDYDYVNDYERLKSFEEDQYEPEYSKNKKTGLEEISLGKNKQPIYSKNLSTLKRSELISKYLEKEIENVNNSSEDSKYLHNTIDKTEYLNRLNEAKIALDQLKRTKTIKNAAPEFYRIGIDVNKLFNAQQQNNDTPSKETTNADGSKTVSTPNTDGSRTDITTYPNGSQITKYYDKDGNEIKENNTKKEEVKKEAAPVTNSKLFSTKPQGLPEHMLKSDYRSYIVNSVKNPFIPGSTQWVNWFDNPFSNPYDSETQPKEYDEWDKSVKGKTLEYSFSRPEGLKESIPSLEEIRKIDPSIKDWGDYIFKAKENPFEGYALTNLKGYTNKHRWNKWKENLIYFNPYEFISHDVKVSDNPISRDLWNKKYKLLSKELKEYNTNIEIFKAATKDELDKYWAEYSKSNPKKGQLGLKFQPYSILDSNYEKYNKLINDVNSGKFTNYYKNQQLNQNKGKINLLDNFMFPINTDKVTNNNSIIENKNTIKLTPQEEETKETSEAKTLIGPSTITGIGDVLSNLLALRINKNIADNYINALQAPTITSTQYITPKVYQDPSRLNDFAALRNSSIPKTSDINIYQNSQQNFNKQLGEYLFKEQTQQATGIRQDKNNLIDIKNKQSEEDTKVANANKTALTALNNQKASIEASKKTKQGEISLDLLNKISNFVAGYKNEDLTLTRPIDEASYRSKLNEITSKKQIIENDPNKKSEDKLRELGDLAKEEQNIHEEYMKLLKNKYNSYFSRWDEKTTIPKTDVFK